MNIEGKKRIVITCPHCHKDYAFNGDYLYQRKRKLAEETSVIIAQLTAYREEHSLSKKELQKDAYYKKLKRRLNEKQAESTLVKTEISNASNISELNLYWAVKKKLFQIYGKEPIMKIIEECEEEMQYNDYDMEIQRYTNFNNI